MIERARRTVVVCALASLALLALATGAGCRDNSRFASHGDRFEGTVVKGSFVRSGVAEDVRMCITLETDHLQDTPGTISSSDGRFTRTPLRPIPQIWHDPLSTLTFGDGRLQNLVYAAAPTVLADAGSGDAGDGSTGGDLRTAAAEAQDVLVVISLMQSDQIEVRLVRGAPQPGAATPPPGVAAPLFGVFTLEKQAGPCAF